MMSKRTERAPSIGRLLEQSEHVKELVEQCATDLSLVNCDIAEELKTQEPMPAVESALVKNVEIQDNVRTASEKLAAVTAGLADQARDRALLDHQFAAAQEQEEAARHASLYDVLTSLPNRALFDDRVRHGLGQAVRHGWGLAVMFIDLDDFKRINDSYGHDIGDRVLQAIGRRLKHYTRSDDTVSRYGGDEFLYLLMEIKDELHVALVAEKIGEVIRRRWDDSERDLKDVPRISATLGIAVYPTDGCTLSTLIKAADTALYVAKRNGTGCAFAERGHGSPARADRRQP